MSCSNCHNGCAEITSDKCIKYTGVNVPALGINNGDSLFEVEQALINFLVPVLSGEGIVLSIDSGIICSVISQYISSGEELTLPNVIDALIRAVCNIDQQLSNVEDDITELNAAYTLSCVTGTTPTSGTHAVLQATINKLCAVDTALLALALNVSTNYVKLADLNSLIAAFISGVPGSTKYYTRMVPNTVVEYYGTLSGRFDVSGAGIGDWEKIYLCNGNNGTPDKRGRVGVGVTTGMGGGAFSPAVDPAIAGNPSYTLLGAVGANTIVLTPSQIPAHTHSATNTIGVTNHTHFAAISGTAEPLTAITPLAQLANYSSDNSYSLAGAPGQANLGVTSPNKSDVSVNTVIGSTGGGLGHSNFQPGLGCYYIMYIP
jgi:microcystin-dependent protein